MLGGSINTVESLSISLGMGLSITLLAGVEQLRWLWGAVAQRSEHLQQKQEIWVQFPAAAFGICSPAVRFTNVDRMKDLWYFIRIFLLSTQIRFGRRNYGALILFSCCQHRCEWNGLWCSSTVQLLSTQT